MKGPAEWFTGDVWIDSVVQPEGDSQLNVGAVHFSPGARTAGHAQANHALWRIVFTCMSSERSTTRASSGSVARCGPRRSNQGTLYVRVLGWDDPGCSRMTAEGVRMSEVDDVLSQTMPRLVEAERALHNGDAEPRLAMLSRATIR